MNVPLLFYAPMKAPGTFPPSGDTHLAALLVDALTMAGFTPALASTLATYDGKGDATLFAQHQAQAEAEIFHLVADADARRARIFFTYHCYHKAPDLVGPRVAAALGIPYVIAEGSRARKQEHGPWAKGFHAADAAFGAAALVLAMTERDRLGLETLPGLRVALLSPFIRTARFTVDDAARARHRAEWRTRLGLSADAKILLAAAMMRPGKKEAGFDDLAAIMAKLDATQARDVVLVLAGNGGAEARIRALMAPFGARARFAGLVAPDGMASLYAASDLNVWPGRKEAFGLSYLEAAAAGLPSIAFDQAGVSAVVSDGVTGVLVPPFDHAVFAGAITRLLSDAARLDDLARRGVAHVRRVHDIAPAAKLLGGLLHPMVRA